MERILKNLTEGLLTQFKSFILQVNYPELNLNKRLRIDSDSIFISFNYTETLQKYYGIDDRQILYIHGKASSNQQLILGHGIDPINFEEKEAVPPENATDEELEEWRQCMADNYITLMKWESRLLINTSLVLLRILKKSLLTALNFLKISAT